MVCKYSFSYLDDTAVRQCVWLDEEGGLLGELLLGHDVVADVAELLLHHAHRLEVGRVVERVAAQQQQLDQVPRYVPEKKVFYNLLALLDLHK